MRVQTSSVESMAVRRQRVEERRAALGQVPADEPQRARLAQRLGGIQAHARLQRIAGDIEVFADDLRQLLLEQVPLPGPAEELQPVGAQPLRERRVAVGGEERAHFRGGRLLEPQVQLPVRDVGLEDVALQPPGVPVELGGLARAVGLARGEEIVIHACRDAANAMSNNRNNPPKRLMSSANFRTWDLNFSRFCPAP